MCMGTEKQFFFKKKNTRSKCPDGLGDCVPLSHLCYKGHTLEPRSDWHRRLAEHVKSSPKSWHLSFSKFSTLMRQDLATSSIFSGQLCLNSSVAPPAGKIGDHGPIAAQPTKTQLPFFSGPPLSLLSLLSSFASGGRWSTPQLGSATGRPCSWGMGKLRGNSVWNRPMGHCCPKSCGVG